MPAPHPRRRSDLGNGGAPETGCLLAVDVGVRVGLALYDRQGHLVWYRRRNYGSAARMRRAAHAVVGSIAALHWVVTEGDRTLARPWWREARRRGARVLHVPAERWRDALLPPRAARDAAMARRATDRLAAHVVETRALRRVTTPVRDAADAIAIGLWALGAVGWRP